MDLDTRGMVEHLQILKNCLTDLLQVLQMHRQQIDGVGIQSGFPLVNKKSLGSETCLEFWFSILVLTSGCSVKSGAKYSKYSAGNTNGELVRSLQSSYIITQITCKDREEGMPPGELTAVWQLVTDAFLQQQRRFECPEARRQNRSHNRILVLRTACWSVRLTSSEQRS